MTMTLNHPDATAHRCATCDEPIYRPNLDDAYQVECCGQWFHDGGCYDAHDCEAR